MRAWSHASDLARELTGAKRGLSAEAAEVNAFLAGD